LDFGKSLRPFARISEIAEWATESKLADECRDSRGMTVFSNVASILISSNDVFYGKFAKAAFRTKHLCHTTESILRYAEFRED